MDDTEQFFRDSHYNIIRVLLGITGLWPFYTWKRRYTIFLAMILVLGSGIFFEILGIIEIRQDSVEIIDAVPMISFTIVAVSKMLCAVCTLPKIKMLLVMMQEYCLSPKSDEETKIQNSHAQYGQKLGYVYTGFILGHCLLYILSTFLTRIFYVQSEKTDKTSNKQIGLTHRVNYMIDLDVYYVPIFIHCAICDFTFTFLIVVFDVLYLTVVEYCCGLFAALRYRLEVAVEKNKLTMTKDKSYSNIAYSIRRHVETIQFIAVMESVHSLSLFIQLGLTISLISFLGYQMINKVENTNVIKAAAFLNGVLINAFFENWQGQKIIDSSEKVFESAYNSKWYDMPISARKLLIMIMIRSEKASILRPCKVIDLSYITFNTIMRTSSSYFMLLRSL